MATYYARANGNVDGVIWATTPTGTAANLFPTFTSADVLMANGFQVTINVDTTVAQIRNDTFGGATTNATTRFNLGSVILTADVITGSHSSADACVFINGTSPTINGNIFAGATGGSLTAIDGHGIFINGTGSLTINGNVTGGTNSNCCGINIYTASAYSVTINGNVTGGTTTAAHGVHFGLNNSGATLTINGGTIGNSNASATCVGINSVFTGSIVNLDSCTIQPALGQAMNMASNTTVNITNCTIASNSTATTPSVTAILLSGTSNTTITGSTFATINRGSSIIITSGTLNITGNISSNFSSVIIASGSTVTVSGNITAPLDAGATSTSTVGTISISSGTINITGDLVGSSNAFANAVNLSGPTIATINGIITGGTQSAQTVASGSSGLHYSGIGNTIINGNVIGGSALSSNTGVYHTGLGTITINGTATGGTAAPGVRIITAGTLNLDKAVGNDSGFGSVGLASVPGVVNSLGRCVVKQIEYGNLGQSPTEGPISFIDLTTNVAIMYIGGASGTKKTLVDSSSTADYPAITDVRRGVIYANGNRTGTCLVPVAANVRLGVAVDNTVGTATLTQANIDSALSSFASGRLSQCATVESTGQQLTDAMSGS